MNKKMQGLLRAVFSIIFMLGIIVSSFGSPTPVSAAIPAGLSEYFIPGFSDDLMAALEENELFHVNNQSDQVVRGGVYNNTVGDNMTGIITISVSGNNTTVYYDHWENGYSTGAAGDEVYTPAKGNVMTFKTNNIPEPRGTSLTGCSGSTFPAGGVPVSTATTCYDGRDRIYVTGGAVSVAQAFWPVDTDTNYANAWEIYPVKPYQTSYTVPVGENLYGNSYWDWFNTVAYNNSNGVTSWSGNSWVETNDDGAASTGNIRISGGKLQFLGGTDETLTRTVPLLGAVDAILSFDYTVNDTLEVGDTLEVDVYNNTTGTWIPLTRTPVPNNFYVGTAINGSGSYSFDLTRNPNGNGNIPLSASTQIRFIVNGFTGGTESIEIDNVKIRYTNTATADNSFADFTNVFVFVQATADNTTITVSDPEPNPDGTANPEVNAVVKQKGETILVSHIWKGTTVTADKPVQVQFLVSEDLVTYGQNNSRGYTAVPSGLWSTQYYSPVPGDTGTYDTDLFIYNPTGSALTIAYEDSLGPSTFSVAANATESFEDNTGHFVPTDSAVYLSAQDGTTEFWAIGSADAGSPTYNWGFTLLPLESLTDEYFVSWAPGGWNQGTSQPEDANYSPIFVTPTEDDTIVYVDYSPTDGTIDETYILDRIEVQKVYDQAATGHTEDADNTGIHIWATAPIALVWGEDQDTAAGASPGLDAGYTILPLNQQWMDVALLLEKTANPDVITNASGETSVFTLTVSTDDFAMNDVDVVDVLPANWAYVDDSTTIIFPDNSTLSGNAADPTVSLPTLTWDLNLDMAASETLEIQFTGITTAAPNIASVNNAQATGTYLGYTFSAEDDAVVNVAELAVTKTSNIPGTVNPGDTISYLVTITNQGTAIQNNIVVTDPLPLGTQYDPNTTVATGYTAGTAVTYRDQFGTAAYTNSNGTSTWSTSWTEGGEESTDNPGNSASGGYIWITGGELNFDPAGSGSYGGAAYTIERVAPLANTGNVTLSFTWDEDDALEAGDTVTVEVCNGATCTTVLSRTGARTSSNGTVNTSIASTYLSASTTIRFTVVGFNNTGENFAVDNVQFQYTPMASTTRDNAVGGSPDLVDGDPSILVVAGDNFDLAPGQSMTVAFDVVVNASVSLPSIDNTVYVTSVEQLIPLEASVSDPLPVYSTIGDRVWLDENSDGVQDAGEAGIPNVTVELRDGTCTAGVNCPTTVTDSEGNYIFTGLPAGSYTVAVISGLPAGLSANPTYDEDGIGTANTSAVTLGEGEEHVTADFGYNWASTTDVTNPGGGATGAIGDRIWIDADGDGVQDPGEAGLSGVTVTLVTPGADGIFGTGDDVNAATTSTDAAGNYIFDGLTAGAYKVQVTAPGGYTQTGDPDQAGITCTTCDNQTTTPIVLAPGDVYVNADFGYQLNSGANTIGNQIFVDSNGDGNLDGGEPGIPGVTVALLDNSGNVIATTVTDANGQYSFPGLPNGTYTVWVNDTANMLGSLAQNSTPNNAADGGQPCGTCNNTNTVTVSGSGNTYQDFGYAPGGHGSGDGLIGDTIFLDRDGGNDYDAGEGLEGVTVQLYQDTNSDGNYDAGEPLVASTTTDENGNYYFGDLSAGNYVVKVDTTTLPIGVTNTVDQGDSNLNEGGTNLSAGEVDLTLDFGYRDTTSPNSLSGTIWTDTDADGSLEGGESGRFNNVTVVLRDSDGNIIATTQTDASGNYSFSNLPDGTYTVDVTDNNNVLNGYWHSVGTQGEADDNQSKNDPYTITLSGGENRSTVDFGYYRNPSDVSNFVWLDVDNDGIQDATEPGIPGVLVTLTATYPNGTITTFSVRTGTDGTYSFGNLLMDEHHDGAGGGEPTYALTFTTPTGTSPSPTGQGTTSTDSNGTNPTVTPLAEGQSDTTYDSGFYGALDLGDLPLAYPTLFQPGPAHVIFPDGGDANSDPDTTNGVPAIWLGLLVDTELDGQPNANAFGDDPTGSDDEDGLELANSGWIAGGSSTATITVNGSESGTTVYFGLWIDWDNNGSLETFYSGSGVTGSPTDVNVSVSVPGGYVADTSVYMRVRASTTPLTIANYQGTLINGEVEDYIYSFGPIGVPTPVSLSYFASTSQGGSVLFDWSTETETGNVGFNLYAEVNGERIRLNDQIIPSNRIDSLERQDYSFRISTSATTYYLEEVSILGETRSYGPFQLDQKYGSPVDATAIDWEAIQAQHAAPVEATTIIPASAVDEGSAIEADESSSLEPDIVPATPQLKGPRAKSPANRPLVNLLVSRTGLYRVTFEMLRDAGYDLSGVSVASLKLSSNGQPVPIFVKGGGIFKAGSYFEFYGQALDSIYTSTNVYILETSNTRNARVGSDPTRPGNGTAPTSFQDTLTVNNQRVYANYAPGADAWYDTYMMVYNTPQTWEFPFQVNGLADPFAPANLRLVVWGLTQWPQSSDHHMIVSINGSAVADLRADGFEENAFDLSVPTGILTEGANTLQITVMGDTGVTYDVIALDQFSLTYSRTFAAQDGRLTFSAAGSILQVTNLPSKNVLVYRLDAKGPVRLSNVKVTAAGDTFTATFAGKNQSAKYLVSVVENLYAPGHSAPRSGANLNKPAQYLIISHPDFIAGVQPLVQARQAQGFSVNVVDVNDVYARYSYGIFDPAAIKAYIAYAKQNLGTKYVLINGGDTYDYMDYLNAGSVSFIPSMYTDTGTYSRYVPSDALFADTNGDKSPEVAIGRFPVRTTAELDMIVQKTLAYGSKDYSGTAVFAADLTDGNVSFKNTSLSMQTGIPANWNVENIFLDDVTTSQAHISLVNAMNRGTSLITFVGHSGPMSWTFNGLFNTSTAANLTNSGRPFVAVQWGCWNNYYVDPVYNHLVHALLLSGDRGAAATLGAVGRTESISEELLGQLLMPRLVTPGMTIGQALQFAKAELAATRPDLLDVLYGYTLMGDPALMIQP